MFASMPTMRDTEAGATAAGCSGVVSAAMTVSGAVSATAGVASGASRNSALGIDSVSFVTMCMTSP